MHGFFSKPDVDMLDGTKLEQIRSQGISAVLGYIFKSTIDTSTSQEIADEVATSSASPYTTHPLTELLSACT